MPDFPDFSPGSPLYEAIKKRDEYWASFRRWRGLCIAILLIVAFNTFSGREYKPDEDENLVRATIWSWWGLKTETCKVRFGRPKGEEQSAWFIQTPKGDWVSLFSNE